jgi:flagellar basal body rod protein FlgF
MKKIFILFIISILSYNLFANDLLDEYKLLFNDLSNIRTVSYKSYFNIEYNKALNHISNSQGALLLTNVTTDFAISGGGFFRIRLENNVMGWTRAGILTFDSNGNILVNQKYLLYDNIHFQEINLLQSIRISNDGKFYISFIEGIDNIIEIYAGQLLIYNVPYELLERYNDTIYTIKECVEYNVKQSDAIIIQGTLEMSNVPLLPVILRMYYILHMIDENYISNIVIKKDLLRIKIEILSRNYSWEDLNFLLAILPYLRYNY